MVAYRLSAQVIGRRTGRSATGAAAYRAACRIDDDRTGLVHDYTRKQGLLYDEILAPENAADWMRDRAKLWNAIELAEKRKDAQLCREILLNLPHELTREQQIELVREFVRDQCVALGMIADIAIHAAHRKGDDRNIHAHVMLSMREATAEGFGQKVRDWNSPELLEKWREEWARCQNRALERAGRSERVDHRSLEAQGIDREPEPKQGLVATQMEREGRQSKAGDDRRAVQARNQLREELRAEAKIIDIEVARIERDEREQRQTRQPQKPALPPAVIFRQKDRFETWANARRADLQNRRLGAEGQQGRGHDRQRLKLERQQESTYGLQLATLNTIAAAIATRQKRGGGLRGLAYRLTGRAERDRQRAAEIQASIGSIEQRKTEQVQALNAEQQADRAELAGRYVGLAAQLEKRIEQRRADREAEGWIPPEARREATTGHETGQAPDIDREAENSPVEGRDAGTGETTPGNEQAPTAQPEQTQEANSGEGQEAERKPKTGWSSEAEREVEARRRGDERRAERQAAIDAERDRQEARDRDYSNDNDPGREM